MVHQDYRYPKVGDGYRWHIQQKCKIAVGRKPIAVMDTNHHTVIRFAPPLNPLEEEKLNEVFSDPASVCDPPELPLGQVYQIKDIYDSDFAQQLERELGCEITFWFPKSNPSAARPDRIALAFSKQLSPQDKVKVERSFRKLFLGWY